MAWIQFIDAAYPPPSLEGAPGLCFYIGGDTVHVWSTSEVHHYNAQYLLPIWVRSNPSQVNATSDANACVSALARYSTPKGVLIALDSETSIDPAYVKVFVNIVNAAGYKVIDYGSQSDVMGNDNPDGYYWGADWTSVPHVDVGDVATQYISLASYDLSEFGALLPLWQVGAPPPPPPPDPAPANLSNHASYRGVDLGWNAVPGAKSYVVQLTRGSSPVATVTVTTTHTALPVKPNTTYRWRVGATGEAWSAYKTFTTPRDPAYWTFGPLREMKVVAAGKSSVKIQITSPDVFTGTAPSPAPGIDHYEVNITKAGATVASYPRIVPHTSGIQEWQGGSLAAKTGYVIWVRAALADGTHSSAWSKASFTTAP